MKKKKIKIDNSTLWVEVACTPDERRRGLMNREALSENEGMLFLFSGDSTPLTFWMKNTSIPLSIAFIGKDNKIKEILDLEPQSEEKIKSQNPAAAALEVNRGWFQKNKITVGSTVYLKNKEIKIKIN
tara:strand:+ start:2010 stop:2393 length:384 start_codon:yes stop_codon:yes gene_type:complete